MSDDAQLVIAGVAFDFRRLHWWAWVIVALTVWSGFGIGWGIVRAASFAE